MKLPVPTMGLNEFAKHKKSKAFLIGTLSNFVILVCTVYLGLSEDFAFKAAGLISTLSGIFIAAQGYADGQSGGLTSSNSSNVLLAQLAQLVASNGMLTTPNPLLSSIVGVATNQGTIPGSATTEPVATPVTAPTSMLDQLQTLQTPAPTDIVGAFQAASPEVQAQLLKILTGK